MLDNFSRTHALVQSILGELMMWSRAAKPHFEQDAHVDVTLEEFINDRPRGAVASLLQLRPDVVHAMWVNCYGAKSSRSVLFKSDMTALRMILASRGIKTEVVTEP